MLTLENYPFYEGLYLGTYGIKTWVWQLKYNGNFVPKNVLNAYGKVHKMCLVNKIEAKTKKSAKLLQFSAFHKFLILLFYLGLSGLGAQKQ